jgi:hypothetical protein
MAFADGLKYFLNMSINEMPFFLSQLVTFGGNSANAVIIHYCLVATFLISQKDFDSGHFFMVIELTNKI